MIHDAMLRHTFSDGMDSFVSTDGLQFSVGQKRKISDVDGNMQDTGMLFWNNFKSQSIMDTNQSAIFHMICHSVAFMISSEGHYIQSALIFDFLTLLQNNESRDSEGDIDVLRYFSQKCFETCEISDEAVSKTLSASEASIQSWDSDVLHACDFICTRIFAYLQKHLSEADFKSLALQARIVAPIKDNLSAMKSIRIYCSLIYYAIIAKLSDVGKRGL
tara:strand:+ start:202 stop:855 length:654 start_codon:yes stop_codon:yes gene_type:complete